VVDLARGIEVKMNSVWFAFVALVIDLYRVADHGQFVERLSQVCSSVLAPSKPRGLYDRPE